jgi:hypothetical protein
MAAHGVAVRKRRNLDGIHHLQRYRGVLTHTNALPFQFGLDIRDASFRG